MPTRAGGPRSGEALAKTLGDPSLELRFRLPDRAALVDELGVEVERPAADDPRRGVVDVELGDRPVGAIVYDALLLDRPQEVHEAGRVVALAVDRERLTVSLRASRARIKHARPDGLEVVLRRADGQLRIAVADAGGGGAVRRDGSGVQGMADRVAALGGALTIGPSAAGGTCVEAVTPCGS